MSNKQLLVGIGVTVVLALTLAWVIEQAQVRRFLFEFDKWYDGRFGERSK